MNIVQMMAPTHPLEIRFESFHADGRALTVDVEFLALVDYDGEREIEYGAFVDGKLYLFNVDGAEITIRRKTFTYDTDAWKNENFFYPRKRFTYDS